MASENPFEVLGVPVTASLKDIKRAFKCPLHRSKALQCHPDKQLETDSGEAFRRLRAAYDILCNEERRSEYEREAVLRQERESRYKDESETRKRFREDLLMREAQYRAQKAAKSDTNLQKKRTKVTIESPERKPCTGHIDFGNVIYLQWTTCTTLYTVSILKALFAPCGTVIEVVLDREKSGAYIVFTSADSAKHALRLGLSEFLFRPATRQEAESAKTIEDNSEVHSEEVKSRMQRLREKLREKLG